MLSRERRSKSSKSVKTALSLSKTKPVKEKRIQQIQSALAQKKNDTFSPDKSAKVRTKPDSQIAQERRLKIWMIPARIAFFLNGLYFLTFSIVAFIGVFSSVNFIKPFFTLPFETSFSSIFLLEIAALFSLLATLLFFYAARHPERLRWFYFFLILLFFPYHLLSNFQKMGIDLPQDFLNYLYFDSILMAAFWLCLLTSLYAFIKKEKNL